MNRLRTLLENVWICKDIQKDEYYKVKQEIPFFQKFVREQLGWRLICTENLIKLEKIPNHAQSFMGIQEFNEIRDYCLLCVILMYLEDKEDGEQFLLSDLIRYIEMQLSEVMEIDWTSYGLRKSLVRVLQFVERMHMLQVYDGKSEEFGREAGSEVLYENTGHSKYFATNFMKDISGYTCIDDFENVRVEGLDAERGKNRVNRVYRQLMVCPMMYWESNENADALYLKNQRQSVMRYLEDNIGGHLDLHRNAAFWMIEEDDCYGKVHPGDAMLPEAVTLICTEIRRQIEKGMIEKKENECCYLSSEAFHNLIIQCYESYKDAWSKEFREMPLDKLTEVIIDYMRRWMMIEEEEEYVRCYPIIGKIAGRYPIDFEERLHE